MEDWKEVTLGSILSKISNGFSGTQVQQITDYKVTRIETIAEAKVNLEKIGYVKWVDERYKLKKGDILISNINSLKHIGKCAIIDSEDNLFHGMNLLLLRFENDINPKFIHELLVLNKKFFEVNASQAVNQASINQTKIKQLKVFIPKSPTEQAKIAEILTKIDESIVQTEALIEKYKSIKAGLMQDLLSKGIDADGKIRSYETHQFKDSPIGKIPLEWDCKFIGEIFSLKSGATPLRSKQKYFYQGKVNWVKTLDLNESDLYETEEKITEIAVQETSCTLFPKESILVAMYGGWEQIGRTGVLKNESCTNQAITALYAPNRPMNSKFVQYILQFYRYKWKAFAASTRKDPNITKKDIEVFDIPFPIDIHEQDIIVSKVLEIENFISNQKMDLSKLQTTKTGLMQDLLSGRVRVTNLLNN